jgi:hypothetical protein
MLKTQKLYTRRLPGPNLQRRIRALQHYQGEGFILIPLGKVLPHLDPTVQVYIPLPEYGMALIQYAKEPVT